MCSDPDTKDRIKNVDSVLRESMIESSNNITNNIIEDFNILASGLTGWEPRSTVKRMRTQAQIKWTIIQ